MAVTEQEWQKLLGKGTLFRVLPDGTKIRIGDVEAIHITNMKPPRTIK